MIIAIIQARMGSTRLPSKVMKNLVGIPVLAHVVNRVSFAAKVDKVLVATTNEPADDVIESFCHENNISLFRGSSEDVLKRYADTVRWQISEGLNIRYVVRITSDCPLIDPKVIDKVISVALKGKYDYVSNTLIPTYPDGLDVEIFTYQSLLEAEKNAQLSSEREHVTPYIKKGGKFRRFNVTNDIDLSSMRWTLDQNEDFLFITEIYNSLYHPPNFFYMGDVLNLLEKNPDLSVINNNISRDEGYQKSILKDTMKQERFEMPTKGIALWRKAKKIIPGGNQLLSKRSEQFLPDYWPAYYRKAKGVDVWDLDNNHYIDMSIMGIGACPLGYADSDVDAAVKIRIDNGSMCTLNSPEEIDLAEKLVQLHPWADMVRYARGGGEAMAIAVRIARAHTKKDKVAFCGYHGWHDWYLSANLADDRNLDGHLLPGLEPAGVPRGLKSTSIPFQYNHIDELEAIVEKCEGKLAAIVMEPIRDHEPLVGFLQSVRKIANENDAVLIIDEVSSGFRLTTGGAHLLYGLLPDIAVFAKAMSNGYPMAAVIGKEGVMESTQDTFISSTYWTEGIGPTAALATIEKYERCDVPAHLKKMGIAVQKGWQSAAEKTGIDLEHGGIAPLSHFAVKGEVGLMVQTVYTQLMLERSFLAGKSFYACYAHKNDHVRNYLEATEEVFEIISKSIDNDTIGEMLKGPIVSTGFRRLT